MNAPDCECRRRLLLVPGAIAFSLFLCLGAPVAFGLDPGKATTQYIHEVWQTQDGLPQNSIRAIAQTNDGYLWLGTPAGLVRFDGVRFTVFDKSNTDEIRDNSINSLLRSRDGSLWIGSQNGLLQMRYGKFVRYSRESGLSDNVVNCLLEGRDGSLLVGTQTGGLIDSSTASSFTIPSKTAIGGHHQCLHESRDGSVWVVMVGRWLNRFCRR